MAIPYPYMVEHQVQDRTMLAMKWLLLLSLVLRLSFAQDTPRSPHAVQSAADHGAASNRAETTLTAGIDPTATIIPVVSSSGFKAGSLVTVDKEILAVCAIPDGTHLNVGDVSCRNIDGRGVDVSMGSAAAASHLAGAKVQGRIAAPRAHQTAAQITAIENKLNVKMVSILDKGARCDGSSDDTAAIQAALNSARMVSFPPSMVCMVQGVSGGIKPNSNQVMVFGSGAELKQIPTASPAYTVINLLGVDNVTIYDGIVTGDRASHTGSKGEWGFGISLRGTTNVRIYNTETKENWGDGVYVGKGADNAPSQNVSLENVYSHHNRRNGLSVTSGIGVHIIGGEYTNTIGTPPECGIDIEPNKATDYIQDITIMNVKTSANKSCGLLIVATGLSTGAGAKPVSVVVDGWSSEREGSQGLSVFGVENSNIVSGRISIGKSTIHTSGDSGVYISRWGPQSPALVFEKLTLVDVNTHNSPSQSAFGATINGSSAYSQTGLIEINNTSATDTRTPSQTYATIGFTSEKAGKRVYAIIKNPSGINMKSPTAVAWNIGTGTVTYDDPPVVALGPGVIGQRPGYLIEATASGTYTLPKAGGIIGHEFALLVKGNYDVNLTAATGDTIRQDGVASTVVHLSGSGNYLKLREIDGSTWAVIARSRFQPGKTPAPLATHQATPEARGLIRN
jgi:hypothetical protein